MEIRRFMSLGMILEEGVDISKFLPDIYIIGEVNSFKIKEMFENHGYDLTTIPGEFIKVFTKNEKEMADLELVLDRIDEMGLREIANANLKPATFTSNMVAKLEYVLNNKIPFLTSDNKFISALYSNEAFALYTANSQKIENVATASEVEEVPTYDLNMQDIFLDEEDLTVKNNIIKTLTEINSSNPDDNTLTFIISSIIANLDNIIAKDNKAYQMLGIGHVVEDALQGMVLTPDMQEIVNSKILNQFPIEENMNRGVA